VATIHEAEAFPLQESYNVQRFSPGTPPQLSGHFISFLGCINTDVEFLTGETIFVETQTR
jgi:hypothetical protein